MLKAPCEVYRTTSICAVVKLCVYTYCNDYNVEVWLVGLTWCPVQEVHLLAGRIMQDECQNIPLLFSFIRMTGCTENVNLVIVHFHFKWLNTFSLALLKVHAAYWDATFDLLCSRKEHLPSFTPLLSPFPPPPYIFSDLANTCIFVCFVCLYRFLWVVLLPSLLVSVTMLI